MKKFSALLFFVLLANYVFATAIVIYITPQFVIMGADSRGSFTNAKTNQQRVATVSKIYKNGNTYFSLAGLVSNNLQGYNASVIINKDLSREKNLKVSIQQVKKNVRNALLKYLQHQKKNNNELYKKNISDDYFITSVGIISIVNNKPYAHIIGFKVEDGKEINIIVDEVFYNGSGTRDAVYYLGKTDEINLYMNTVKDIKTEPEKFVEELIIKQAGKTPGYVSLPVDIIKLTNKQTTWVKKQKDTPITSN